MARQLRTLRPAPAAPRIRPWFRPTRLPRSTLAGDGPRTVYSASGSGHRAMRQPRRRRFHDPGGRCTCGKSRGTPRGTTRASPAGDVAGPSSRRKIRPDEPGDGGSTWPSRCTRQHCHGRFAHAVIRTTPHALRIVEACSRPTAAPRPRSWWHPERYRRTTRRTSPPTCAPPACSSRDGDADVNPAGGCDRSAPSRSRASPRATIAWEISWDRDAVGGRGPAAGATPSPPAPDAASTRRELSRGRMRRRAGGRSSARRGPPPATSCIGSRAPRARRERPGADGGRTPSEDLRGGTPRASPSTCRR